MMELVKTKDVIPSVKYYLLNGWQGLVQVGSKDDIHQALLSQFLLLPDFFLLDNCQPKSEIADF